MLNLIRYDSLNSLYFSHLNLGPLIKYTLRHLSSNVPLFCPYKYLYKTKEDGFNTIFKELPLNDELFLILKDELLLILGNELLLILGDELLL